MIDAEQWAEVRRLRLNEGLSACEIARRTGLARGTVARWAKRSSPPKYPQQVPRSSIVDPYVGEMVRILAEYPEMGSPALAKRVGYTGGMTVFYDRVAQIRDLLAVPDPVDRLVFEPGELVQCDLWFPKSKIIPTGFGSALSPPVLTMVSGYSSWVMAMMLPSRSAGDLVAGMSALLAGLGAVPSALLWDNEAGIGRGGKLSDQAQQFAGALGVSIRQTRPYDPESKGMVERANKYLQTSFLPGREFESIADFNAQLDEWLIEDANARKVRRIGGNTPAQFVRADVAAMRPLRPVMPKGGFTDRRKLGRDYLFRVLGNDYSCPPEYIGKMIDIHAGLDAVRFFFQGREVASYPRCVDTAQTVIAPAHLEQAAILRQAHRERSRYR